MMLPALVDAMYYVSFMAESYPKPLILYYKPKLLVVDHVYGSRLKSTYYKGILVAT